MLLSFVGKVPPQKFEPQDVVETASSDMGDVSQIAPLLQLQCACFCLGTQPHSWVQVAQGKSSRAAKDENTSRTGGRTYQCPIPDEVVPAPFRVKE